MIELEGIFRRGGRGPELSDIDLIVPGGVAVAVVGATGAGKSHLAAIAAARAEPDAGRVWFFGRDARKLRASSRARLRRQIGFIPQNPQFFEDERVLANVGLPLALEGAPTVEVNEAARAALCAVELSGAALARVRDLSGGERRRAALARALVGKPQIIVADDPIAGLDLDSATRTLSALEQARADGAAVLIASAEPRLVSAARYLSWELFELGDGCLAALAPRRTREQTDPGDVTPKNVVPFPAQRAAGGS